MCPTFSEISITDQSVFQNAANDSLKRLWIEREILGTLRLREPVVELEQSLVGIGLLTPTVPVPEHEHVEKHIRFLIICAATK